MTDFKAVFFDAGNTLLRVDPNFTGPMVDWPELTPMSGIAEVLVALRGRCRLVVLSNAQASTNDQLRAALRRVGLDSFFDGYLTARAAGVAKPSPAFFAEGLRSAGAAAGEAVMVGDSYDTDILGAKAAGWRAVWYNPFGEPCPSAQPAYDGELRDLRDLPELLGWPPLQDLPGLGRVAPAVRGLRLPDLATCDAWLNASTTDEELLAHSRLVAAVAFRLAEQLRKADVCVDPLVAHRGGLLHDIAKAQGGGVGRSHDRAGAALLRERGQPVLAAIAERHSVWAPLSPDQAPETWEEKLVYYADRLVEGNAFGGAVVTIDERLAAMLARHPEREGDASAYGQAAHALEREIAARLGLAPAALVPFVRAWVR